MLKKILLLFFTFATISNAQDWSNLITPDFVHNGYGYSTNDLTQAIDTDPQGNAYVTGYFEGRLILGSDTLISKGSRDIFVAKFRPNSSVEWAISAGGESAEYGQAIGIAPDGSCYISGYFFETAHFGDNISISSYLNTDAYVAKIDSDGNWEWARSAGGSGYDKGQALAIGSNDEIYVGGIFTGISYFGSDSVNTEGLQDGFVAKINSSGTWQWAENCGGSSTDDLYSLTVGTSGNVYAAGYFRNTAKFGLNAILSSGNKDIYAAKINPSGIWQWASKAGSSGDDVGYGITVDNEENIYIAGNFENTVNINSDVLVSAGKTDAVIAKISDTGAWLWGLRAGGTGNDVAKTLTGKNNGIIAAGTFQDMADINSVNYFSQGSSDIFTAEIDSSKSWGNIKTAGSTSLDDVYQIKYGSTGGIYTCGYTYADFNFGVNTINAKGNSDGFILRQYSSGSWVWGKIIGGTLDYSQINKISSRKHYKYIIGTFYGSISLGDITLNSQGLSDIYVAKLDSSDNYIWAKNFGGTGYDEGNDIDIDTNGNIYIAGTFYENASFGGVNINAKGLSDAFAAKLDNNGNCLWAKSAGSSFSDIGSGLAVDNNGNVFLAGSFYQKAYFDGNTINAEGYDDAFLAKLDNNGNWLWYKPAGGDQFDYSMGVEVDSAGNAYLFGSFEDDGVFGAIVAASNGNDDGFIAKINAGGTWQWVAQCGGSSWFDRVYDIWIKNSSEIYACGSFSNLADFDAFKIPSKGSTDAFLGKINGNGDWQWVNSYGNSGMDIAYSIDADADNYLYLTGTFSETVDFSGDQVSSAGEGDVFLMQTDEAGNMSWIAHAGGESDDRGIAVSVVEQGVSYVAGYYHGSAVFDINSAGNLSSLDRNAFIAKNEFRPMPDWEFTANTGRSSTIMIPDTVQPKFNGFNVSYGDAIGVFFDDNGSLKCAGFGIWESAGLNVTVWGDDYNTQPKDGYTSGEKYKFMIWDAQTDTEYIVNARFSSGPKEFSDGAVSVIMSMPAEWDTLSIQLQAGWNSIASYCDPAEASMNSIMQGYTNNILIVKDGSGKIFVPQYNINTIGNWDYKKGYQVYCTNPFELKIAGVLVEPENSTLALNTGWNFIAYLRDSEMNVATAFSAISNKILIVKNGSGKIFVPQYNINTIGNLKPTAAYQIYLTSPANYSYPAND